jgi:hypothetical protein
METDQYRTPVVQEVDKAFVDLSVIHGGQADLEQVAQFRVQQETTAQHQQPEPSSSVSPCNWVTTQLFKQVPAKDGT